MMIKPQLLFYVLVFFLIIACGNDQKAPSKALENEETVDAILDDVITTTEILKEEIVATKNEEDRKIEKFEEERKNNIKKQLKESKVVKKFGTNCSLILEKYKTVTAKYINSGDETALDSILSWDNDPVFISCKKIRNLKPNLKKQLHF